MNRRKIIGITMGDPASIGPEITIKAFLHDSLYEKCNPIVIGDSNVLEDAKKILGITDLTIHSISNVSEANFQPNVLNVLDMKLVLFISITIKSVELNKKSMQYAKQTAKLEKQIEEAEQKKRELEAKEEYMKTDEYIKEIAKEKLNLVEKGEKVFKPTE